jgi:hypothetical protein
MNNGERDARIVALHERGWTVRAIAAEVGLSPTRVHQVIAAAVIVVDDTEDDDPDVFDDNAVPYDIYEPIPRFVFVGLAIPEDRRGEPLRNGDGVVFAPAPRAIDGNGVSVSNPELEIYRWCVHAEVDGDSDGAERVRTDWARQLEEAGVSYDDERGRWIQARC